MPIKILIPCKPLAIGKSRLGGILSPIQRKALCSTFLARTLHLARSVAPAREIAVISSDAEAAAMAQSAEIETIADVGLGLNTALSSARDSLARRNGPITWLAILPIDLPLAGAGALFSCLDRHADVVIAPDAARNGTNFLCLGPRAFADFEFCYGPDSYESHARQAERRNLRLDVVTDPGLAVDIDCAEDYLSWTCRSEGAHHATKASTFDEPDRVAYDGKSREAGFGHP